MTILVTGGAGYIGSQMVHALVDSREAVVVLDNLSTGFEWAIPKGVQLVVGNSGDRQIVDKVLVDYDIDTIIHFAASVVVPESVRAPLRYYLNNTANSRTLLERAVNGGVRHFVFSSTAAVYGSPSHVPVHETAPTSPISPYGWSKLMTEIMLRDVADVHGITFAILRYFNVAGADPLCRTGQSTNGATHLIKVAVEAALGLRPKLEIFGTDYATPDGTCIRDYIHVSDLVAAHSAAVRHLRSGGRSLTLNCGYGHGVSVKQVIATVKELAGVDFVVENAARRPGDPEQIVADATQIREMLDWRPEHDDLPTIVRHALAWERERHRRNENQRMRRGSAEHGATMA